MLKPLFGAAEAKNFGLAGVRLGEPQHDADGGGLSGPVFAQQGKHDAGRHFERNVVERDLRAETLGQSVESDDGRHGDFSWFRIPAATTGRGFTDRDR